VASSLQQLDLLVQQESAADASKDQNSQSIISNSGGSTATM
jgi:hypothetical protein